MSFPSSATINHQTKFEFVGLSLRTSVFSELMKYSFNSDIAWLVHIVQRGTRTNSSKALNGICWLIFIWIWLSSCRFSFFLSCSGGFYRVQVVSIENFFQIMSDSLYVAKRWASPLWTTKRKLKHLKHSIYSTVTTNNGIKQTESVLRAWRQRTRKEYRGALLQ